MRALALNKNPRKEGEGDMIARMRHRGTWKGAFALTLGLLMLTGCRSSSSRSGSGGCGGGCCRGQSIEHGSGGRSALASAQPAEILPPTGVLPNVAPPIAAARPYGGQKTCPVMDEPLGSMGPAIPISVEGETIYVCCKGCAAKVQHAPEKYLAKVVADRAGQ